MSPCGVWIAAGEYWVPKKTIVLPTPCGEWAAAAGERTGPLVIKLPSPCGEWGAAPQCECHRDRLLVTDPLRGKVEPHQNDLMNYELGLPTPCGEWIAAIDSLLDGSNKRLPTPCGEWIVAAKLTGKVLKILPLFYRIPDFLSKCKGKGRALAKKWPQPLLFWVRFPFETGKTPPLFRTVRTQSQQQRDITAPKCRCRFQSAHKSVLPCRFPR